MSLTIHLSIRLWSCRSEPSLSGRRCPTQHRGPVRSKTVSTRPPRDSPVMSSSSKTYGSTWSWLTLRWRLHWLPSTTKQDSPAPPALNPVSRQRKFLGWITMDPKWEFNANQFVDFNNIQDQNNSNADEFFDFNMETGERWVSWYYLAGADLNYWDPTTITSHYLRIYNFH